MTVSVSQNVSLFCVVDIACVVHKKPYNANSAVEKLNFEKKTPLKQNTDTRGNK